MAALRAHHLEEDRREDRQEEEGTLRGIELEPSRVESSPRRGHGVVRPLHSLARSIALLRRGSTDLFPFAHVGAEQDPPFTPCKSHKNVFVFPSFALVLDAETRRRGDGEREGACHDCVFIAICVRACIRTSDDYDYSAPARIGASRQWPGRQAWDEEGEVAEKRRRRSVFPPWRPGPPKTKSRGSFW